MPVAPTLPISSLSTKMQQEVLFGVASISKIAIKEVKAQMRSSCP